MWSNIDHIASILLDSIYTTSDTEILFARFTNTSINIQIEWTPIVSILNNLFVSGHVE